MTLSRAMLRGLAPPLVVMLVRVIAVFEVGEFRRKTAIEPSANASAARFEARIYSEIEDTVYSQYLCEDVKRRVLTSIGGNEELGGGGDIHFSGDR